MRKRTPLRPEYKDRRYVEFKAMLRRRWVPCCWCGVERATSPDHEPSLDRFAPGRWSGDLLPSCLRCNMVRGGSARQAAKASKRPARNLRRRWV